jgi:hypothetical protein
MDKRKRKIIYQLGLVSWLIKLIAANFLVIIAGKPQGGRWIYPNIVIEEMQISRTVISKRVTRRVLHVEQELITFPEHMNSPSGSCRSIFSFLCHVWTVRDICISSITILGYIHRPPCGLPAMITKKFAAINLINQETKPSKVLNNIYWKSRLNNVHIGTRQYY